MPTDVPFSFFVSLCFSLPTPASASSSRFTQPPQSQAIVENDAADFSCEATGPSGDLHYEWLHNGQQIRYDSRVLQIGSNLRIESVQRDDAGDYVCIAASAASGARQASPPAKLSVISADERFGDILKGCKIVVATLCGVAQMYLLTQYKAFSHIFIDEAAASMEAEALMGIAGVKRSNCHVILSGDPKQLGPVIKNKRAASLGLDKSLMERLLHNKLYKVDDDGSYDTRLQLRLRRNYRSHPEIVGIYNQLYYDNQLIPMAPLQKVNIAANWGLLPNGEFPILFNATYGKTEHKHNSTSSFNLLEAKAIYWCVKRLLTDGLGNDVRVQPDDIGVITPYLAQCKCLKDMLRWDVEVGTVESYQGREKPIIIVSLVSSFMRPYFLSNPRRVNVLLSRAKCLLILIGNPESLGQNEDFQHIIDKCKLRGTFLKNFQKVEQKMRLGSYHHPKRSESLCGKVPKEEVKEADAAVSGVQVLTDVPVALELELYFDNLNINH
ncbi:hypothetical protein AWZ03_002462 [Drosophila navojoa]|uniref:Ig-like domain-containing protein n=1 Tax=Drosophila navojoa TaxID=7232 RepID=A0A484BQK7_DRONA|nr:hypothetical protein AWZ03_002462 [Drosophila navojoa]